MRWFRMYDEVVHDPKVQRLSGDDFKQWVNMLCLASSNNGVLPPLDDIAYHLRVTVTDAKSLLARFVLARLLDEDGAGQCGPHNWENRQFRSDESAERVRAYRQRVRDSGRTVGGYLHHKDSIFARDGSACVYCGSREHLCLDHMIPVILGGDDELDNLCTACKRCNSGKAGRTPEQAGYLIHAPAALLAHTQCLSRLQVQSVTLPVTLQEQSRAEQIQNTEQAALRKTTPVVDPPPFAPPPSPPKPQNGNGNGKQPNPPEAVIEHVRKDLLLYPPAARLRGQPDNQIVCECIWAVHGDLELLSGILATMNRDGKKPEKSWAYFPTVIKGEVEKLCARPS